MNIIYKSIFAMILLVQIILINVPLIIKSINISIIIVGFRLKYFFQNMMFKQNLCKVIKNHAG